MRAKILRVGTAVSVVAAVLVAPATAAATSTVNDTPFPSSTLITGAQWTTPRYDPPLTQYGDIFPTTWAADGQLYATINDGGLLSRPYRRRPDYYPTPMWKNFLVRIIGRPPAVRFKLVGRGRPLGRYWSDGLVSLGGTFYATQVNPWNWRKLGPFTGLRGIPVSTDGGHHWTFPNLRFSGPTGNLTWVQEGRDQPSPDGFSYAISTDREFNASTLFLGRSLPDSSHITNPSQWQWSAGSGVGGQSWTSNLASAVPILTWTHHITYPEMTFVPGIGRYLLSFSYSYHDDDNPGTFTDGAELVVLEAPQPWGPFRFVFRQPNWGPSNGYGGSFPIKWQSTDGRDLWMDWAANFDKDSGGCLRGLQCSGKYGFNLRRLHLTLSDSGNGRCAGGRWICAPDLTFADPGG